LADAADANTVQSDTFFGEKRARKSVKTLNGVAVNLTVAVFQHEGDLVIEGEVPEQTLLVVKNGALTIHGFVGGHVVAERDVTINGNVGGGVVMSSRGSVTAQRVLSGARVIAFRGAVDLESAESPAGVFGWSSVRVRRDVIGGRLIGAQIEIDGSASGAELHVAQPSRVAHLRKTDRSDTAVFLRRQITCEDYGREMTPDEVKLLRAMGRHSYSTSIMDGMRKYADRNIRDSRATYLYMLLCANLDPQAMSAVRGLQAQANLLDEVMGIIDLMSTYMLSAVRSGPRGFAELEGIAESSLVSLTAVSEDVTTMSSVFRVTHKGLISTTADMLARIAQSIRRNEVDSRSITKWVQDVAARRRECAETRESIDEHLDRVVANLGLDPAVVKSVESNPHKLEAMLQTLTQKLKKEPANPRAARMRSPLARLLNNTIERNRKSIEAWSKQADASRQELDALRKRLTENATVIFGPTEPGTIYLDCEEIQPGVVFYVDPRDHTEPKESALNHVTINSAVKASTRYVLHGIDVQRRSPAARSDDNAA